MNDLTWTDEPALGNKHPRIMRCKFGQSKKFVVFGKFRWAWLHFCGNLSVDCWGEDCNLCPDAWRCQKGYAAGAHAVFNPITKEFTWSKHVIEIPQLATLPKDWGEHVWMIERIKTSEGSLWSLKQLGEKYKGAREPFDVRPTLEALWRNTPRFKTKRGVRHGTDAQEEQGCRHR